MISAFADAFPSNTQASHEQMYERALLEALQVGVWESDYQLPLQSPNEETYIPV